MKRPTVLLLITTFEMGGAERVYIQLANGLVRRGYRVIAACLQSRGGVVRSFLDTSEGIEIVDLRMSSMFDIGAMFRLIRVIKRHKVDVVYTFLIHPHILGRLAARLAGTSVLISSQQTMLYENRWLEWANRVTARYCDRVVAASRNVEEYLANNVRLPRAKLVTIYNSVDAERLSHVQPSQQGGGAGPTVGCCARLTPEKDHAGLIRAISIVKREFHEVRLLLAGDGPERSRIERQIESEGLGQTVQLLGHLDDVEDFYSKLDVYVQSSYVEGLPCAVLEALACALPGVVTRVGGNEEIVKDGESGLTVPPRDPVSLASAILWMLQHPEAARTMGQAGQRTVRDRFSTEAMVTATDRLIAEMLEAKVPGSVPV